MNFYIAEATQRKIGYAFDPASNIDMIPPKDAVSSTNRREAHFVVHNPCYYYDYRIEQYTRPHLSYYSSDTWNSYNLPNLPPCDYSHGTVAESFLYEERTINHYEGDIVSDERRLDNAWEYIINIPPITRQQEENGIRKEFGNAKQINFSNKTVCEDRVSTRRKAPKKRVKCSLCGKDFACNTNYKVHLRTHTGCKPYACVVCAKTFASQHILSVHMRSHTGAKPYSCSECDRCFSDASTLIKHRRTHSGLKPFPCDVCGKTFSQRGNMTRHRKSHQAKK